MSCDGYLYVSASPRALPVCSGEAFTWGIRQPGSQGLIQLQNTLNPSILWFSPGVFWLGNKCAGLCGNSPTAPCLECAELEAGAGQPQAQDRSEKLAKCLLKLLIAHHTAWVWWRFCGVGGPELGWAGPPWPRAACVGEQMQTSNALCISHSLCARPQM